MTHITDENLPIKLGKQQFMLLALQNISQHNVVMFVTLPNKTLVVLAIDPKYFAFIFSMASKQNSIFILPHPIKLF